MLFELKYENGNILVSTLLVMLAMNLLAITLVQTSMRQFKIADFKTTDSTNFYLAETCIDSMVTYLRGLNVAPIDNDADKTTPFYNITQNDISNLYDGTETQEMKNRLAKFSYNCTLTDNIKIATEGTYTGTGEDVGSTDTYGNGSTKQTSYYTVESFGKGPSSSTKKLIAIVSMR